jgi:hypothetical protein
VSLAVEPSAHSMEPRRFLAAVSIAGFVVDGGPLRPVRACFLPCNGRTTGMGFRFGTLFLNLECSDVCFFWIFLIFFDVSFLTAGTIPPTKVAPRSILAVSRQIFPLWCIGRTTANVNLVELVKQRNVRGGLWRGGRGEGEGGDRSELVLLLLGDVKSRNCIKKCNMIFILKRLAVVQ